MTRAKARFLVLLLPVAMAACSTSGSYPSLALRDVERASGSGAPAPGDAAPPAPALPPASEDLLTRLKGLVAMAREADGQFQSSLPAARRTVAAAGTLGSDSWSSASVALARLESSRSASMSALAELDMIYADARDAAPNGDSPTALAIQSARTQVSALTEAQDQIINELGARLKG